MAMIAQAYLDNAADVEGGSAKVQAVAKDHAPSISRAVDAVAPTLADTAYPIDPDLLVDLRQAAGGLALAAQSFESWAASRQFGYGGDFVTALDGLTSSRNAMIRASAEFDRLDAAGTLHCP
jgi:hypothetical protein